MASPATTTKDDLQRSFTSVPLSANEDERINTNNPASQLTILSFRKIHDGVEYFEPNRSRLESLLATKNYQGGLRDSKDESKAKVFFSETGQQSAPHIQLELMPRQQEQRNADRVLVENNFYRHVTT